jgi:hypothetical protein
LSIQGQHVAFEPAKLLWLIQRDFLRKLFLWFSLLTWFAELFYFCRIEKFNLQTVIADMNFVNGSAYSAIVGT